MSSVDEMCDVYQASSESPIGDNGTMFDASGIVSLSAETLTQQSVASSAPTVVSNSCQAIPEAVSSEVILEGVNLRESLEELVRCGILTSTGMPMNPGGGIFSGGFVGKQGKVIHLGDLRDYVNGGYNVNGEIDGGVGGSFRGHYRIDFGGGNSGGVTNAPEKLGLHYPSPSLLREQHRCKLIEDTFKGDHLKSWMSISFTRNAVLKHVNAIFVFKKKSYMALENQRNLAAFKTENQYPKSLVTKFVPTIPKNLATRQAFLQKFANIELGWKNACLDTLIELRTAVARQQFLEFETCVKTASSEIVGDIQSEIRTYNPEINCYPYIRVFVEAIVGELVSRMMVLNAEATNNRRTLLSNSRKASEARKHSKTKKSTGKQQKIDLGTSSSRASFSSSSASNRTFSSKGKRSRTEPDKFDKSETAKKSRITRTKVNISAADRLNMEDDDSDFSSVGSDMQDMIQIFATPDSGCSDMSVEDITQLKTLGLSSLESGASLSKVNKSTNLGNMTNSSKNATISSGSSKQQVLAPGSSNINNNKNTTTIPKIGNRKEIERNTAIDDDDDFLPPSPRSTYSPSSPILQQSGKAKHVTSQLNRNNISKKAPTTASTSSPKVPVKTAAIGNNIAKETIPVTRKPVAFPTILYDDTDDDDFFDEIPLELIESSSSSSSNSMKPIAIPLSAQKSINIQTVSKPAGTKQVMNTTLGNSTTSTTTTNESRPSVNMPIRSSALQAPSNSNSGNNSNPRKRAIDIALSAPSLPVVIQKPTHFGPLHDKVPTPRKVIPNTTATTPNPGLVARQITPDNASGAPPSVLSANKETRPRA
jgi:hypothetical protein